MEFRILGALEVWHDGAPVAVSGTRQRELLAFLALHANEAVSTDRLMDALWGEDQPAAGATALRVRVSQLRKALRAGGDVLVTRPPGYALVVEPGRLDLARFETLVEAGERALGEGDPARAAESVREALALWRGAPLADVAYAPFAQTAAVRLEELRAAALELRIEADLALGRHGRLVGELQALVGEHPLRERLWAQLMLALYRDGRQAEALAAYRSARARLVEEIGIEPSPALQELERRILAQDAALAEAARPAPPPRRCVLAVGGAPAAVAEELCAVAGHELIAVALVEEAGALPAATRRMHEVRERARERGVEARAVAFTTADPAADAVRLATEHDAALLVLDAPPELLGRGRLPPGIATVLRDAVCDVAMLSGGTPVADGPVAVPFAGHPHDWSAVEVAAWLAADRPLRLLGVGGEPGRDASRLLASASLALQRGMGIACDPVLVEAGPRGVLEAAAGSAALVVGLSDRWRREGLGAARAELARSASCPVLLVRGGLRPSGLAPPRALTRFTWSGGG